MLALLAGCAAPRPPAPPPVPVSPGPPVEVNVPTPSLLDLDAPALRARFGPPIQARRDGGAEIWNYEAADFCRLNLVLQRLGRTQRVVHAQARMDDGGTEAMCLSRLERR
jgi:hypothetical protein